MLIETSIRNPGKITVGLSIAATLDEWNIIKDALKQHVSNNYYGPPYELYRRVLDAINSIEGHVNRENFDLKPSNP